MSDPTVHSGLGPLSSASLTEDANLQAALRRIAQAGSTLLSNCACASVTLIETGVPSTVAASNETALILDESQYEVDDGPCLTAARTSAKVRVDDAATDRRWPNFSSTATDIGVWSSLSMPLQGADESFAGCLNLYGREAMAFSDTDEQMASAFADQASVVVANTRTYWAAFEMTKNLAIAMESREIIDQAKGILMERHRVDGTAAFAMLRERSKAENRKLREIASEIADGTTRRDA